MPVRLVLFIMLFCLSNLAVAQELNNLRQLTISTNSDSLKLDTLSIIPSTFQMTPQLDSSAYRLNFAKSTLYWNKIIQSPDSVELSFRVFPYDFAKVYRHKHPDSIPKQEADSIQPYVFL